MRILKISRSNPNSQILLEAVNVLHAGGIVAHPTDTCYGLAVDVGNFVAVKKLRKLKGITDAHPFTIIPPTKKWVLENFVLNLVARNLTRKFWPGPLTLILPLKQSKNKIKTCGVRIPDCKISQKLVRLFGQPITTTSANRHGEKEAHEISSLISLKPDLILDGGKLPIRPTSTILDVSGKDLKILREGKVKIIKSGIMEKMGG